MVRSDPAGAGSWYRSPPKPQSPTPYSQLTWIRAVAKTERYGLFFFFFFFFFLFFFVF